ncbi:uncharacterized protein LOC110442094 [Mizuhopecten yessoensis]|uniref:uncharacterized protein LOC110442094 n=1 Tax=Mizuhopecten yessoensis TaxID=6573 RepID=UPI000B458E96|nr:uncharacterized protein LOC110442094 [Mizuhopecten yessoensis]
MPDNTSLTITDAVSEIRRIARVASVHEHKPQVAFQAKLDNSQLSVGNGQTIKFHIIDFNIGNGYNHLPGVFTCKEHGLYMFHLTMVLYPGKFAEFTMKKNGHTFGLWTSVRGRERLRREQFNHSTSGAGNSGYCLDRGQHRSLPRYCYAVYMVVFLWCSLVSEGID